MGRIAEAQLAQRPMHLAWSRVARGDLLIVLEDGSVHRLDVDRCLRNRRLSVESPPSLTPQVQFQEMCAGNVPPRAVCAGGCAGLGQLLLSCLLSSGTSASVDCKVDAGLAWTLP